MNFCNQTDLFHFRGLLAQAINKDEKEAMELIYSYQPVTDRTCMLSPLEPEMLQKTINCTEKNYLYSLRDRVKDDKLNSQLVLALFVYSKNMFFTKTYGRLPESHRELISLTELSNLVNSEYALQNYMNKYCLTLDNLMTMLECNCPLEMPVAPVLECGTAFKEEMVSLALAESEFGPGQLEFIVSSSAIKSR